MYLNIDIAIKMSLLVHLTESIGLKIGEDILIKNDRAYYRMVEGSLGLGESYMDGDWSEGAKTLDEIFELIGRSNIQNLPIFQYTSYITKYIYPILRYLPWVVPSDKELSKQVAEQHYDLSIDMYREMLGPTMTYSCGYWAQSKTLTESQLAKMDLICRKCGMKSGMNVLDIGCGWGTFARYAAEKYNVYVTGITISTEQYQYAIKYNSHPQVRFLLLDYRDLKNIDHYQAYNCVVSIGMFEHVGVENYATFMDVVKHVLEPDGIALLHTIGGNRSKTMGDPWMNKYIFPNSMVPSLQQITAAVEGNFIIEDVHNFGPDYAQTLMEWYKNFLRYIVQNKLDERFVRRWKYYLLQCAGMFRARQLQLYQVVLTRGKQQYRSVR